MIYQSSPDGVVVQPHNRIFTIGVNNDSLTDSGEKPMKVTMNGSSVLVLAALALGVAVQSAAAASGDDVFSDNCAVCHSPDAGTNKLGPSLFGVVGRKAGSVSDYAYAPAMKNAGLTWDQATLDKYITDPQSVVPGTKMLFPGIKSADDRKALIQYLATLH
jgi:cytochrome c